MAPPRDMASEALKLGYQISDQDAQEFLQEYPLDVIQQSVSTHTVFICSFAPTILLALHTA